MCRHLVGHYLQQPVERAVWLHRLYLLGRDRGRRGGILLDAALGVLGVGAGRALALFFSNRAKSGSTFAGVMMTVWQLFVGLAVFVILAMLDNGKKAKK